MSDPREPSEPESTEKTPATPAEPSASEPAASEPAPPAPSMPPFPSGPPTAAAPATPAAPTSPPFVPPTAPLAPASSSLPPIQKPPTAPSAPSAPSAPGYGPPSIGNSAPSYGPPSTSGASSSAPSYGAPPVYGTPPSTSSSVPTPVYGSKPTPAGAPPSGQLPYAQAQIPPSGKGGWMGIVSLILGGLALLFCWVPFLDVITVFGAIAGLVLGLIAVFRKLGSRVLSLIGTIVSGLAFVLSVVFIIIYAVSFFSALDSASDYDYSSPSTSKPYGDPSETDSPDDQAYPGDPTAVPGDPTPSADATVCTDGTAIALGKAGIFTYDDENQAEVTINDVNLDATDEMLNKNSLNETPPDGYRYAIISLTIKQLGNEPFPAGATDVIFKGVAEDLASPAQFAVVPEPWMLFAPNLTPGASVTANVSTYVPVSGADTGSVLLSNYLADNVCEMKVG
ncbi:hypothetical protein [Agreia pratensis]|nr:hypothetical protein [Agreia pratensis]